LISDGNVRDPGRRTGITVVAPRMPSLAYDFLTKPLIRFGIFPARRIAPSALGTVGTHVTFDGGRGACRRTEGGFLAALRPFGGNSW
jgi:hypothetical protein